MNYTTEQITQIVARVINELEKDNISTLSINECLSLAYNPNTPPETLERLSYIENDGVRGNIAANPITPSEILAHLADDENCCVRHNVTLNPNTSSETLTRLANDKDELVRMGVATNHNSLPETIDRLVRDENWKVRREARHHKKYDNYFNLTIQQRNAIQKLIDESQDQLLKNIKI